MGDPDCLGPPSILVLATSPEKSVTSTLFWLYKNAPALTSSESTAVAVFGAQVDGFFEG
ncbi:hypothetical protein D3C83_267390 [compost metagenome]